MTVEQSLRLNAHRVARTCLESPYGGGSYLQIVRWPHDDARTNAVVSDFQAIDHGDRKDYSVTVTLNGHSTTVDLLPTLTPLGGVRWWWECPECRKRRKDLYSIPGSRRIRCRVCWGLSYCSSAENHRQGALFDALFARGLGLTGREYRRLMRQDLRQDEALESRNCWRRQRYRWGKWRAAR